MFRLRESFSQQGMDLVDVSVGDSAVGQQARQDSDGTFPPAKGEVAGSGTTVSGGDEAGMLMAAEAASQAMSKQASRFLRLRSFTGFANQVPSSTRRLGHTSVDPARTGLVAKSSFSFNPSAFSKSVFFPSFFL